LSIPTLHGMKIDYKRHLRIITVVSIVVPTTITYGQLEGSTIGVKKLTAEWV
jgi:hypothetical protein